MGVFEQISGAITAVSAAGMKIGSRYVYRRGKTVDVGSYGGYVNSHACSHKDKCVTKDLPSRITKPPFPLADIPSVKQRAAGRKDRKDRKTEKDHGEGWVS